jgi:hypothetical protein
LLAISRSARLRGGWSRNAERRSVPKAPVTFISSVALLLAAAILARAGRPDLVVSDHETGGEARWDSVLSRGKLLFGVADDDSHIYKPQDAENPDLARPGRGWIWVRADTLSWDAIIRALQRGDFHASTGIVPRDLQVTPTEYRLEITPVGDRRNLTAFVGQSGRVLATSTICDRRIGSAERNDTSALASSTPVGAWRGHNPLNACTSETGAPQADRDGPSTASNSRGRLHYLDAHRA